MFLYLQCAYVGPIRTDFCFGKDTLVIGKHSILFLFLLLPSWAEGYDEEVILTQDPALPHQANYRRTPAN